MKKIFCMIEEPFDTDNGEIVCLYEGLEIQKKHGVKRMYRTGHGSCYYDNFDEWTLEKKDNHIVLPDGSVFPCYVLRLNPYSKPHKPQIIKGDNFLFIG